ncbi:hypothetical protein ACFLXT_02895 [Chloroflexota bacterium]
MPSKSRHGKSKQATGKKKKGKQHFPTMAVQPLAVAQVQEPVARPQVPVSSVNVPTLKTKPVAVRYPYIAVELRTIGILAGIILVILVILALVLP